MWGGVIFRGNANICVWLNRVALRDGEIIANCPNLQKIPMALYARKLQPPHKQVAHGFGEVYAAQRKTSGSLCWKRREFLNFKKKNVLEVEFI